ncbi:PorV/PorQ family protein, partial [candidate division KSB1 bacterium]|nr:PorV/PorQ family protein [candidate division KSB1 bacterium]
MNQIIYRIFFGLFVMLLSRAAFGQVDYNDIDWGVHPMEYSSVGTVGWQFLKLPTNARHAAMGGVNSSVSHGDATSALTNPASITDVQNMDFSFGHMKWVADINYQSFAAVKNFNEWGAFGISLIYVDYGSEIRTEYQEELSGSVAEYSPVFDGLGTFSAYDMAVGISYARQITNKLQVGGNVKYMREQIDDAKTSVWSLDIGTVFYTGFKSLRISMLGKHFGPDAEFRQYSDRIEKVPFRMKMPMQLSLGAAMDLLQTSSENA